MAKFIIMALPRSRTKWLSEWLSFEGRFAIGHDLAVECSSIQDFEDSLDGVDGTIETGAVLGWRVLRDRQPRLRIGALFRPIDEVLRSLDALGLGAVSVEDMALRNEMLHALAQSPGVARFDFHKLSQEAECARLWEWALQRDFDFEWWNELAGQNIQIDMAQRIRRLRANAPGLELLKREIVSEAARLASGWGLN